MESLADQESDVTVRTKDTSQTNDAELDTSNQKKTELVEMVVDDCIRVYDHLSRCLLH